MASRPPAAYPPEPWNLRARVITSVFLVPESRMPDDSASVPAGFEPVRRGDRRIVGVAAISYRAGGVLQYEEVLEAHLVTIGNIVRVAIPRIWVDSEASLAGGRELWSIPKHLGQFQVGSSGRTESVDLYVEDRRVAAVRARSTALRLPGVTVPLPMANRLDGRDVLAPASLQGRAGLARASWRFDPQGPLGHLAGLRPSGSAIMPDAAITFGAAQPD